ncbi:hypothetical protein Tco_0718536 [Tanacetum coccineum]
MIDRDKIMDVEVYYDTTTSVSAHYSENTFALSEQIEVLSNNTGYTIQSIQHQPGPGHPNTFYYLYSDESDEDEPSEELTVPKSIHPLSGSPTPSSNSIVASLTPFGDSDFLLEETDTLLSHFDHSFPDYEAFCFDVDHQEEKSSGEKSSDSTTSYSDLSFLKYESFYFDLSIDPLLPAKKGDSHHEEFADELVHIISPPEYDHFYFYIEVDSIELRNKDKFFDPGIFIIKGVYSKRSHILPLYDFSPISFVSDLLLTDPSEIETFLSFPSRNEDKVFDPRILLIDGVLSFTRKTPHLLSDNFKIDKRHILSEISLKIVSFVNFLPKDKGILGESS